MRTTKRLGVIISLFLTTILALCSSILPVQASNDEIKVFVDGQMISFDVPPMIIDGRTMVPLRAIFEKLGAVVSWDADNNTAIAVKDGVTVILPVGSFSPTINGVEKNLDVPAQIVNGRTLAPLRFVGEAFGSSVTWNANTQAASIISRSQVVNMEYKNYTNARFGFNLSYPDIFTNSKESDNGDGITLESSDGLYTLKIWGAYNINNSTGKNLLDEAKNRVAYISSEYSEDNIYRLEYGGGGNGQELTFYECGDMVGDKVISYILSYPSEEKDKFAEVITRMSDDMVKGNFKTDSNSDSNKNQINYGNTNANIYEITKLSYTDKNVKINYPQIANLSDSNKQKTINEIIKNEALKVLNYYSGEDTDLTLEINFDIKWNSTRLLSIQYSGVGYVKDVAHPNNLFYTTNIDINKGSRLRLEDLVNIDESFVAKFKDGKFKALNPEQNNVTDTFTNEDLIKEFSNADSLDNIGTENQSDTFSYLTKDSLGISVSVGHAAGEHAEFEIKYQDMANNLKVENEVWKDFSSLLKMQDAGTKSDEKTR